MNINFGKPKFEKGEFLLFNCFTRAFVIFLAVCGTIEAVMSCFAVDYDRKFVFCTVLFFAIILSLLEYSKPIKILIYIAFLFGYVQLLIYKKNEIISALYSFANLGYEVIRIKFQFPRVDGFPELITDRYFAITQLVIIGALLFTFIINIIVSDFMSIIFTFLVTSIFVQCGLIFDASPNVISICMIFSAWIIVIVLGCNGKFRVWRRSTKVKKRKKSVLIKQKTNGMVMLNLSIVVVIVFSISVFSANFIYNAMPFKFSQKPIQLKEDVDTYIKNAMIVGFSKFKHNNITYSISGGQLGSYSSIPIGDNQQNNTKISVEFVPFTKDIMYLKSYVGTYYKNNCWTNSGGMENSSLNIDDVTYTILEENFINQENKKEELIKQKEQEVLQKQEEFKKQMILTKGNANPDDYKVDTDINIEENKELFSAFKLKMKITNVNGDLKYSYFPYYINNNENITANILADDYYDSDFQKQKSYEVTMYNYDKEYMSQLSGDTSKYDDYAKSKYLQLSDINKNEIEQLCKEQGFSDNDELIEKMKSYFKNNFTYTANPGMVPWNTDFVNYFLFDNKRGHCAHFASAATLIFRQLEIPARYVEGYIINPKDVSEAPIIEDVDVEDKIQGIPINDDINVVKVDIGNDCMYSWVEIYKEGFGWIAVDVSPIDEDTIENIKNEPIQNTRLDDIIGMLSLNSQNEIIENKDNSNTEESIDIPHKFKTSIVKIIKNLSIYILLAVIILILVLKMKMFISLNTGSYRKRIYSRFIYFSKAMNIIGINAKNLSYKEFTNAVNLYFEFEADKADYISFILEKAHYSPYSISKEEYHKYCNVINEIIKQLPKKSGFIKFLLFMVL